MSQKRKISMMLIIILLIQLILPIITATKVVAIENGNLKEKVIVDAGIYECEGSSLYLKENDVYVAISMQTCVNERRVVGGPAKDVVEKAILEAMEELKK